MRPSAALALLAMALAGCNGAPPLDPTGSSTGTSTATSIDPAGFDGEAAYAFVEGLVTRPDGSPRFRVPGTETHREAALWLHAALQVPGWTVRWHNFTGAEYQAMPKGQAERFASSCAEPGRVAGLEFSNLVALRESDAPGNRTLALGAHWESKRHADSDPDPALRTQPVLGANDGASGVGVLLQLMRHLDGVPLPYDVAIVLFDGEDGFVDCHPLAGSIAFVQSLSPGEVDRLLLLDMVGDPQAAFVRESMSERCDPDLVDLLWSHGRAAGLSANFGDRRTSLHDDHLPFIEAGIPAVDLVDAGRARTFPPYWHTTGDTLDKLSPRMLGQVGGVVTSVLQDPAFVEQWPDRCVA